MRSKRDIKKSSSVRGGGGVVLGFVGGGVTFVFFNHDAISDHTFIRSRSSLKNHTRFQTIMVKIISVF